MSDRDSSSYSSGSDSGSYESSSEEEAVLKPVFLSKNQRKSHGIKNDTPRDSGRGRDDEIGHKEGRSHEYRRKEIALSKAGHEIKAEKNFGDEFGGIEDTDDVDPQQEYEDWMIREKGRYTRDRELKAQEELIKDDRVRRENLTEKELVDDFNRRQKERALQDAASHANYHKGAFFGDNESIGHLLKRTHEHVADDDLNKDHSRPTRLKFN